MDKRQRYGGSSGRPIPSRDGTEMGPKKRRFDDDAAPSSRGFTSSSSSVAERGSKRTKYEAEEPAAVYDNAGDEVPAVDLEEAEAAKLAARKQKAKKDRRLSLPPQPEHQQGHQQQATRQTPQKKRSKADEDKDDEAAVAEASGAADEPAVEYGWDKLPLSEATKQAISGEFGFEKMTEVQARCIPPLLAGRDLLGAAPTGSGKTLAFLVPVVESLRAAGFKQRNGTGAVIVVPVRELAIQIYTVLSELCTHHAGLTHGLVMGGANRRTEAEKLVRGVNILVATPGRLLDHLQSTRGFVFKNLAVLVMDEADRMLEEGFEDELRAILHVLPKDRQTMLFSATLTESVRDIARLSMRSKPVFVAVRNKTDEQVATAEGLEQGYVVCEADKRFLLLYTFLSKNRKKKVIVFFSTCNSVKYYAELLNYIDLPVMDLHGKQKQKKRTTTFFEFCQAEHGTLLCTDVAARGLDIPAVDWIIQFESPESPSEYIHRVGRTARGVDGRGRALLFLQPSELGFLKHLKHAKVPLNEYEFPDNKIAKVQDQLEKVVQESYHLFSSAREAYRSYLQAYAQHPLKYIFDVHQLDLLKVAKSFGFSVPPKVHLKVSLKGRKTHAPGGAGGDEHKSRHGFSEDNPYGTAQPGSRAAASSSSSSSSSSAAAAAATTKRTLGDGRQWSR